MPKTRYLIVGAGMTVDAAVAGIRKRDPQGSITLIIEETHPPYNCPPLSKGLWKGKPLDGIWRKTESHGVGLLLGRSVRSLDLASKAVTDETGAAHGFEKLLLAAGGPRGVLLWDIWGQVEVARPGVDFRAGAVHARQVEGEGCRVMTHPSAADGRSRREQRS